MTQDLCLKIVDLVPPSQPNRVPERQRQTIYCQRLLVCVLFLYHIMFGGRWLVISWHSTSFLKRQLCAMGTDVYEHPYTPLLLSTDPHTLVSLVTYVRSSIRLGSCSAPWSTTRISQTSSASCNKEAAPWTLNSFSATSAPYPGTHPTKPDPTRVNPYL